MATKPTEPITIIAEDDVNLPSTGQPNKELPNTAVLTTGYDDNQVVTAENLNYTFNNHGQWLKFLDESRVITEQDVDTLEARTITAGDGLTGGGDLTSDRTLTLGTPSTLDGNSTNTTTNTSHTHALSLASSAEAQEGTDNTKLMTPLTTRETFSPTSMDATTESVNLPNGMIMKWGVTTVGNSKITVNFTTPFPNNVLNIQATSPDVDATVIEATAVAKIIDNTSFYLRYGRTGDQNGIVPSVDVYWFAIGY